MNDQTLLQKWAGYIEGARQIERDYSGERLPDSTQMVLDLAAYAEWQQQRIAALLEAAKAWLSFADDPIGHGPDEIVRIEEMMRAAIGRARAEEGRA